MQRRGLTDCKWARIRPLLLPIPRTAWPPRGHRVIVHASLWLAKTRAPWRDLPGPSGDSVTIVHMVCRLRSGRSWRRAPTKAISNHLRSFPDAVLPCDRLANFSRPVGIARFVQQCPQLTSCPPRSICPACDCARYSKPGQAVCVVWLVSEDRNNELRLARTQCLPRGAHSAMVNDRYRSGEDARVR